MKYFNKKTQISCYIWIKLHQLIKKSGDRNKTKAFWLSLSAVLDFCSSLNSCCSWSVWSWFGPLWEICRIVCRALLAENCLSKPMDIVPAEAEQPHSQPESLCAEPHQGEKTQRGSSPAASPAIKVPWSSTIGRKSILDEPLNFHLLS